MRANGALAYAKMLKTTTGFCEGRAIALAATGDVFIAGMFSGSVDLDPGAATAAVATGRRVDVRPDPRMSLDVDTPDDLAHPTLRPHLPTWLRTNLDNRR